MGVPGEVVVGCAYALGLALLATALPWSGQRIRQHRDLAGCGPSSGADAWTVYAGTSALLLLLAAALVIRLGMENPSPATLTTTGGIGLVVLWTAHSTWKRWSGPRAALEARDRF